MASASPFPARAGGAQPVAQTFVLPRDVNSVMLENLHAVAGPRTRALLDAADTANTGFLRALLTVN